MSVALVMQHAMRTHRNVIGGLPSCTVFFHIAWGEEITEHKMCVLIFSTILSEIFLILSRME
jgi:hypothetical protein